MKQYLMSSKCKCGKNHSVAIDDILIGKGVISKLPEFIKKYRSKKPFLLADCNTFSVAGKLVSNALEADNVPFSKYIFTNEQLEPNEEAVGSAVMHFDTSCDLIIGIGSGVINDIGKMLSVITGKKYIIVATAPSMDGYASATSSMNMDGLKVSLNTRTADVIIGDTDVLKNAPKHMLKSGIGDMLAKYISIAEWRIAHIITGEYYCEEVADLIRKAGAKCVDNAEGLLRRDEKAIEAVFEGLVIGGVAMAYAGVSRPASGVEHYFSHIWDMRGLEFGTQVDLHGIQCAMATYHAVRLYEKLKTMVPDALRAKKYVDSFSFENWKSELRSFLGNSAETMIAQEAKEHKYDKSTHPARYAIIEQNWNLILQILEEELPPVQRLSEIMDTLDISKDLNTIGVDSAAAKMTFQATKDIRDKYVMSRLAWDLGVLDELCKLL